MIKVRSKTLFIPAEEQSIGAVGEAESTIREFHIDRISGDGVDLANLIFRLNLRYAGVQRTDRSDLEKVVTDSTIILRWTISAVTLKNPGTIFVQLDAFDDGGACRWKSYQGAMYVEKSVGTPTATPQELSELEQLERKLEKLKVASESLESIEQTDKKFTAAMEEVKANKEFVAQAKDSVDEAKRAVDTAKQAVDTAKQAVDTAKAEYEAAKQDIIDKRLEVNALYGDVFKAKTSVSKLADDVRSEVRIAESEKTEISNKIAEVGRAIIGTQAFSESAKTAAQNASASADRASASETKVTEALKKAEKMGAGGTVSGVTETEMHQYVAGEIGKVRTGVPEETMRSYVAGEIGKVKTGVSTKEMEGYVETKSKEIADKSIEDKKIKPKQYGAMNAMNYYNNVPNIEASLKQWTDSPNSLVTANEAFNIAQEFGSNAKNIATDARRRANDAMKASGSVVAFVNQGDYQPRYYILQRLKEIMRTEGRVPNIGDYVVIGGKKFYVVGVNCQFNSNRNGEILPIENHMDFICMDTGVIPALSNEQVAKYKADPAIKNNWSVAAVNKIMQECVFPSFQGTLGNEVLDEISEKFVGFYGEEPLFQKLWIPTEKELLGTNVGNPEYKDTALQGQYPYFVLHPNAYISNKLFLLSKSIGGQLFFSSNGTVLPGDFGFLQANGGKNQMVQIPIGFRIQI